MEPKLFGQANRFIIGCALTLSACAGQMSAEEDASSDAEPSVERMDNALFGSRKPAISIDPRRSLAVTEQPILARFSFERVMNQLVSQARVPGLTAKGLFQQWWDTQNPAELAVGDGPHCDSTVDAAGNPTVNGFPYVCRPAPAEGAQASCDPFVDDACKYIPIGLFNRFDLAPQDGSSCGEHRIVFAKTTGQTDPRDRNLLIFEAALPNPAPWLGLAGCRPIVEFWAGLSRIDDVEERAERLERFYFEGLSHHVPAVVDIANYGVEGRGQVRTNSLMQPAGGPRVWTMREFKLERECSVTGHGCRRKRSCTLQFVPVTDKNNPFGPLFEDDSTEPKAAAFQRDFVRQVESLAGTSLMDITMDIPDRFNSAQSMASQSTETNYLTHFEDGGAFSEALLERLDDVGSDLEPVDIVARAQTQTCAGCHRLSNDAELGGGLTWPASLGFTHVAEDAPETVDGVVRYRISDALTSTFLPHRQALMESFLGGRPVHHHPHHREGHRTH